MGQDIIICPWCDSVMAPKEWYKNGFKCIYCSKEF